MAKIFPKNPQTQTNGEKILLTLLNELLDDWFVFYEPLITGNKPDFIIFHPDYGLSVIEVKDFSAESILSADSKLWEIVADDGTKTITSPLEQVIKYRNKLINLLSSDEELLQTHSKYKGRLVVPISILCCFPFISREEPFYKSLSMLIPKEMLLIKEDMNDINIIMKKYVESFKKLFVPDTLTSKQIERIIQNIYPRFQFNQKKANIIITDIRNLLSKQPILKFYNHVEELLYVADIISDWYNSEKIDPQNIAVVVHKKRSFPPDSKSYIQLLSELLERKNFKLTRNIEDKNSILIIYYEDFGDFGKIQSMTTRNNIIFTDFNMIAYSKIKTEISSLKKINIIITSSQKNIMLMED